MGSYEKDGDQFVFRQDDGEITAWFEHYEEKQILTHTGSPVYKKVFYLLVLAGSAYLAITLFII